ncbi:MAG: hypothetical protein ABIN01_01035 [Ferruginibacter sp.]
MELIDEQYQQISKFVDGEMEAGEYLAFGAMVNGQKDVRAELELYKEIDKLSLSIMQKLNTAYALKTNTANHKPALNWIRKARAYWEDRQENTLKRQHGFLTVHVGNNSVATSATKLKTFWKKLTATWAFRDIKTNIEKCSCKNSQRNHYSY